MRDSQVGCVVSLEPLEGKEREEEGGGGISPAKKRERREDWDRP